MQLPAVVAVAERSCTPAKARPETWPDRSRIHELTVADLPVRGWGSQASPTSVDGVITEKRTRTPVLVGGNIADQVAQALMLIEVRGCLADATGRERGSVLALDRVSETALTPQRGGDVLVVTANAESPGTRALIGEAARLAASIQGLVTAVTPEAESPLLGRWGADQQIVLAVDDPEPTAQALAHGFIGRPPWAILGGPGAWEREVLGRLAIRLHAGLMSDLVSIDVETEEWGHPRLVGLKPSGDGSTARILSRGATQIATVRTGNLPLRRLRAGGAEWSRTTLTVARNPRIQRGKRVREPVVDALERADVVIGVGRGVDSGDYPLLEPLLSLLGAELAATRKVTDLGWQPHGRQVGITARSISPCLYLALGISGSANHLVGAGRADTILAVNSDPTAEIFSRCDIGIVADWREVVPRLVHGLARAMGLQPSPQ